MHADSIPEAFSTHQTLPVLLLSLVLAAQISFIFEFPGKLIEGVPIVLLLATTLRGNVIGLMREGKGILITTGRAVLEVLRKLN
jgi:hypothetical protein